MCSADDADMPAFCHEETRTARKQHTCCECRRIIQPKEKYQHISGRWDSMVASYKTCQHCLVVQKWLVKECNGYVIQGLREEIFEHAEQYSSLPLARYCVGMRRKWQSFKDPNQLMPLPKTAAFTHAKAA